MTSADVARLAGVSRATVSYVLNDAVGQTIPSSTREKVRVAAAELGYSASAAARTLRKGRSDIVLHLRPDWPESTAMARMLHNLTVELAHKNLTLLSHEPVGGRDLGALCRALLPAAVISMGPISDSDKRQLKNADVLSIEGFITPRGHDELAVQSEGVGLAQVAHLVEHGHRTIGFAATCDLRLDSFNRGRAAGVAAGCAEHGLVAPFEIAVDGDDDLSAAKAAIESWLASGVSAVACYNDEIAFAVLAAAAELGVKVPAQLAVIGVDDIPLAALAQPALSSVRVDLSTLAEHVAARVAALLAGEVTPADESEHLVSVVQRAST